MKNFTDFFKWNSKYSQNKINNFNTTKKTTKIEIKYWKNIYNNFTIQKIWISMFIYLRLGFSF